MYSGPNKLPVVICAWQMLSLFPQKFKTSCWARLIHCSDLGHLSMQSLRALYFFDFIFVRLWGALSFEKLLAFWELLYWCREIWVSTDNIPKGHNLSFQWNLEHLLSLLKLWALFCMFHISRKKVIRVDDNRPVPRQKSEVGKLVLVLPTSVLLASGSPCSWAFPVTSLGNPSQLLWSANPCTGALNSWHSSSPNLRFQL